MSEPGTLVIRLAYDGTDFNGFAPQKDPALRTVAGEITDALGTLLAREVDLTCAGRTDAGVHARGQVVSIPLLEGEEDDLGQRRLHRSLSAILPDDIAVRGIALAPPGFSPRFDAIDREYRYRIHNSVDRPLFTARFSWWIRKDLDTDAMERAAGTLLGEHDFASFCLTRSAVGINTVRTLETVELLEESHLGEDTLTIRVVGTAFLHSMVRTVAGSLVDIGLGHRPVEWMEDVLAACDRRAAGQNAPARGLTFWRVRYDEKDWIELS